MFERVYNSAALREERRKGEYVVQALFHYYLKNLHQLPQEYLSWAQGDSVKAVVDYISGLTDNYALDLFHKFLVPKY